MNKKTKIQIEAENKIAWVGNTVKTLDNSMDRLIDLSDQLNAIKAELDDQTDRKTKEVTAGLKSQVLAMIQGIEQVDYVRGGKVAKVVTTNETSKTAVNDLDQLLSNVNKRVLTRMWDEGVIYTKVTPSRTHLRLNDYKE
jgi:hypothetical protein